MQSDSIQPLRIVFMGSAELACPSLQALLDSPAIQVVAVVTQPDRPKGRHQRVAPCPVRAFADARALPVLTPEKAGDPAFIDSLRALEPDLIVLVAYGQILKRALLDLPRQGAINMHPSLLPRYRGAAPIQWAIARGERETGISIMHMSERMDAGDIILQEPFPIRADDTAGSLEPRLAARGAELLLRAVMLIREGRAPRVAQDETGVTLAPKLKKEHGRIDWRLSADEIHNRVRAFNPWPAAHFPAPGNPAEMIRVLQTSVESGMGRPGEVLEVAGSGPLVSVGGGALRLLQLQPPGKNPMSGRAFLNGHQWPVGLVLA